MKNPVHLKDCFTLATAMLAFLALAAAPARADHLRGMIISWQVESPGSRTVRFNVQYSQRWSYPAPNKPFACPSSGLCVQMGATIPLFSSGTAVDGSFDFGDGSAPLNAGSTPMGTVTSINNAEDWYVATFTFTHTYPDCAVHTAYFGASMRVFSLVLAHDKLERVEVQVSPCASTGSAAASVPAIQAVPLTNPAGFNLSSHIAKADPSDTLSYRLASSTEMFGANATFSCTLGGLYNNSGQPPGLSISSATGKVTWDLSRIAAAVDSSGNQCFKAPAAGDLWAVQFIVTITDKNHNLKGTLPIDVILQFVRQVGSQPSLTFTPASPLPATVGSPVTFAATGNSTNPGARITLNASGVPAEASATNLNRQLQPPVSSNFSWTPTAADIGGHVVTYTATDENSQQVVKSMTINVAGAPPLPELRITTTSLPEAKVSQPYLSDLAGTGGVPPYRWSADLPADAGLLLNAATGEITGTPLRTGSYEVSVKLSDSQGSHALRTFTLQIIASGTPFLLEPQRAMVGTPVRLVAGLRSPSGGQLSARELPLGFSLRGEISGSPVDFTADGDGRFGATFIFRSTGDVPVRLRATGAGFESSGESIVNVAPRFDYNGGPILIDLGHLKAGSESCQLLPFARDQEGQVPLRFRLLQAPPAHHSFWLRRTARESYRPGATIPLNPGDQVEVCLDSNRWAHSSQATGEPWIALLTSAYGVDREVVQVRLIWQVEEMSFWERWKWFLLGLLIFAVIAFFAYGYIKPRRFPRDLALTFVPEYEDLDASPQPLAQWRGVGIGFYRDAKAFLHPDFRISGQSRGALAMLKASKQGVWVVPVSRIIYREIDLSEWEELQSQGRIARSAIVYRVGELGPFFRMTSTAPRRRGAL